MNPLRPVLVRLLPFLRGQPPLEQEHIERILLVGCGSRLNIERAAQAMRTRFPAAHITLLAPRALRQTLRGDDRVTVTPYTGLRDARCDTAAACYDLKVVLFTGEGQTALKLLSFALPARRTLIFTEGGGVFSWSFDQRLAVWNHLTWRLGGGRPFAALLGRMGRAMLNPLLSFVAFIALLAWHGGLLVRRTSARRRRVTPQARSSMRPKA